MFVVWYRDETATQEREANPTISFPVEECVHVVVFLKLCDFPKAGASANGRCRSPVVHVEQQPNEHLVLGYACAVEIDLLQQWCSMLQFCVNRASPLKASPATACVLVKMEDARSRKKKGAGVPQTPRPTPTSRHTRSVLFLSTAPSTEKGAQRSATF